MWKQLILGLSEPLFDLVSALPKVFSTCGFTSTIQLKFITWLSQPESAFSNELMIHWTIFLPALEPQHFMEASSLLREMVSTSDSTVGVLKAQAVGCATV